MAKETTALDSFKQIESKRKEILLKKSLKRLKECAKEVLKQKEMMNEFMKQLNISSTDKKSIIDRVNSLPDVKLSDDDEIDIEDKVKNILRIEEEGIEKIIERDYMSITTTGNVGIGTAGPSPNLNAYPYATISTTNGAPLNLSGGTLNTSFCSISNADIG